MNLTNNEMLESVKNHVYLQYPFLLENKSIHFKCEEEIRYCIECYLLENNIILSIKNINHIVFAILNNEERMYYALEEDSKIHDLSGREIKCISKNERYFASVRLKEIKMQFKQKSIDSKVRILIKKIDEIKQWKNEYIKLTQHINERIDCLLSIEERTKGKRKELEYEISQLKIERNNFNMLKQSKQSHIGKYMKDLIIKEYLDKQTSRDNQVQ